MAYKVQSDIYFNNKKKFDAMGIEVAPIDLNGGYVCPKTDKWGMDSEKLEIIERNMQEQFGLVDISDGDE